MARSLLYYIFLSAATIFSNIIRETRHPQVREDLASLNMAATFFATLVPADGSANYAGFMARMGSTLERIARIAVDKDEKRARDPDDREQEYQPPGAKRHNSRTASTSHTKPRRRPSTLRASITSASDSHQQFMATGPPASNTSATTRPRIPDPSIPEALEGLPPVNSSGYVVPLSPSATNDFTSSMNPPPTTSSTTNYTGGLGLNLNEPTTNDFTTRMPPSWHLPQNHSATTPSPLDNMQTPFSQNSSTATGTGNMIPDSWQVPLTADWEFGDNLWAGLFPTEAIAASAQGQEMSLPILSAESFLDVPSGAETSTDPEPGPGYGAENTGYNFASGPAAQEQNQDSTQADLSWPNGVLGLF